MRYCVYSSSLDIHQVIAACERVGGQRVKLAPKLRQVFCDLEPDQVEKLMQIPGLKVKEVKGVKPAQVAPPVVLQEEAAEVAGLYLSDIFNPFRDAFTPILSGLGLTVAVLDSGISKTHECLKGKVVREANFSDAEDASDEIGHGTGVGYTIAGGAHGSRNTGVATGANLMNIKVLGIEKEGKFYPDEGSDEMVVTGIDHVCDLVTEARTKGKWLTDPTYPNIINLSLGKPDEDGDPDDPVRVACRIAVEEYGLQVIASAGNSGPNPSTILVPACDPEVIAVGGIYSDKFEVWEGSSRGPTKEGNICPDFVCWSTDIHCADSESDSAYKLKSGTSFSCPIICGVGGLIWELGRRTFGEPWLFSWYDARNLGEAICIKPENYPIHKDNAMGFGLPALNVMVREAMGGAAPEVSLINQLLPLLIIIPMLRMVM